MALRGATGEVAWRFQTVCIWFNLSVPNLGGPLLTASGLVSSPPPRNFIRAFDTSTGKQLWKSRLPAGGQATPMCYRLRPEGKQFVVIAAGGHEFFRTKLGDYPVAYALGD